MLLPLLAASDYGIAVAIGVLMLVFVVVGWVIIQGTRAQLAWRQAVEAGDVPAITTLVTEEIQHWKSMRMPKGADPAVWRGVQSAELVSVSPAGVRLSATAEGQYATVDGVRREIGTPLDQAFKITAKLADMAMYDIPNVRLPDTQIDVYTSYRDESGPAQRCILSTLCTRETGDALDWDELTAEEVVRAFGGRFLLDDRGGPLPIDPEVTGKSAVPAAFYKD
ncbi:MAG TPA: hypothetical protein VEZ14_13580 [Dehalococcoidia bacterium]|nr:hypothetical protein [Dehalococcoidia bacterium]